ncbi:hypothetical protein ABZ260_46940 [Streptosporangium sp. NPDC006013]|uniref:hypothetical protein n=1 Tax=Streptosporangium sp. NPDC006013 TaxID=3155596 RepID=UPI00339E5665
MHSSPVEVQRFFLYAGHFQFYLRDEETYWDAVRGGDIDGQPWAGEASELVRIGVEPTSIAVGTARQGWVPMTLRVHASPPPTELLDEADHVVEADLALPTGRLSIYGCDQEPGTKNVLVLPPNTYRTRISYMPTRIVHPDTDDDELGDHFEYRVEIWVTTEETEVHVLKQGPTPWSG